MLEARQAEPHAMPDYVVLLFGPWRVFQPQKVFRDPQQLAKTLVERVEVYTATEVSQGAKGPKHQSVCAEPRRRLFVWDLRNVWHRLRPSASCPLP